MSQVPEQAASAALSKITYSSAGVTVIGGLTANEVAAYVGAAVAVLAYITKSIMDWYFKNEHLKLERQKLLAGVPLGDGEADGE